ncbi:MAG: transcription termination/antitermination protein NusA [Candidatus Eremiobacteraeota bacterium]|nr:transcription termination/antitermination protein NusA [Candidatus Eremiobacteraeota bacterium]MBV9056428.1 transcription termination/antitermination protein NusA [Candidatus Eremiobacteraeota bacterium]MBV9698579.1 transcription termination/antitermination protein NusA [Candidatus Eremiobacteraeota bacterium]
MATIGNTATDDRLIDVLQSIARERNISFEMLLEALEAALLTAYKRHFGSESNAIVMVDRQSGAYRVFHRRTVVDDVQDPKLEISVKDAGAPYQAGDFYDEEVTPKDFGRIAAQTAKQVIVQRIREAERDTVYNKYVRKLNDLVTGTVQRYEQRNMYVTLEGRDEAVMYLDEQVPGEAYRINDFIRAYVLDVKRSPKGPQVILSRTVEGLVQRLMELEIPEIADGTVEIMAIARDPGSRSKVAVRSNRAEVDPIGACLGPKSSRIANVTDNLRGEKVDVIRWDPTPATFIMNALAPAKVIGVELFEDEGVALVIVPDYQLSLAIGRDGQNVRLAARLTGWRLDIAGETETSAARERYLAERAERAAAETPQAEAPPPEEKPAGDVDAELIAKLEEFRRERLGRSEE